MDVEEFSFPATAESSFPGFIDSPPLWRAAVSPLPSFSLSLHYEEKKDHNDPEVRSCGSDDDQESLRAGFGRGKGAGGSSSGTGEERMDMLWEDFNEELEPAAALQRNEGCNPEKEMARFGCVKVWSISKANTTADKPGVVVLLKVLRKLFLIHSHHRSIKKRQPPQSQQRVP